MKILHIGKKGNISKYIPNFAKEKNYNFLEISNANDISAIKSSLDEIEFIIADAISQISGDFLKKFKNLKLLHSEGVGYNFFDLNQADKQNVYVCNCKGMNSSAVAEHIIMLMLTLIKDTVKNDFLVKQGKQIEQKEKYMKNGNLLELSDLKIGLIGFGDIAKSLAKLLKAFNATTYYYNRTRASKEVESLYNVNYLPLDELLKNSDIISLNIAVTDETKNLANKDFFNKMKPNSYFINTSRGELVDEMALIEALKTNKISKAGIDTLKNEPITLENPILKENKELLDKIILSPHIAGITSSSFKRGYETIFKNIERIENNQKPINIVNFKKEL